MQQYATIAEIIKAVDANVVVYMGNRNAILHRDLLGDLVISWKPWKGNVARVDPFYADQHSASEFFS